MPIQELRFHSLMILGAAIMTRMAGSLEIPLFLVLLAVVAPLWLFNPPLDKLRGMRFWKVYGLLNFIFFVYAYFTRTAVGLAVFMLVLFCLVYELYGEARRRAPARLIGLLSFLVVVYKTQLDSGLDLFLGLMIYLFSIIFCIMGLYLGPRYDYRPGLILRKSFPSMLRYLVFVFALGMILYWIIPRPPGRNFSSLPSLSGERISGFSDRVNLNDIGSLKRSRKHVLDLKPLEGNLNSQYLKGRVMSIYDRGTWSSRGFEFHKRRDRRGVYSFRQEHPVRGPVTTYRIDQEPFQGNPLFWFDRLLEMEGNLDMMQVTGYLYGLNVIRGTTLTLSYTFSASAEPAPAYEGESLEDYLQIPADHGYLYDLTSDLLVNAQDAPIPVKADMLLQFFINNFEYTLDINNRGERDPLRSFLFDSRAGHCELFASSMVLMLRSQGIHARMVTGFLIPEPHPSGNFYSITESDAHAWVEVLYDNAWHTFDPTPPATFVEPGLFENQLAYLRWLWRRSVVSYDHLDQVAIWQMIVRWASDLGRSIKQGLPQVAMVAAVLFVVLIGYHLAGRFNGRRNRLRDERLTRMFREIEQLLTKQYPQRQSRESFRDYVRRIRPEPILEMGLNQFLDRYQHHRFGPPSHQSRIDDLYRQAGSLIARLKGKKVGAPS